MPLLLKTSSRTFAGSSPPPVFTPQRSPCPLSLLPSPYVSIGVPEEEGVMEDVRQWDSKESGTESSFKRKWGGVGQG